MRYPEVLNVMAEQLMETLESGSGQKESHVVILRNLLYLVRLEKNQNGKRSSRSVDLLVLSTGCSVFGMKLTHTLFSLQITAAVDLARTNIKTVFFTDVTT